MGIFLIILEKHPEVILNKRLKLILKDFLYEKIFFILTLVSLASTPVFAEDHKTTETRKDTYSEPHPNVKSNGCAEGEHVDDICNGWYS